MDKNTSKFIIMLGLTVSIKMAAKANYAPKWFGHVLRTEDNSEKIALNFEVRGKRKKGSQRAHGGREKL